jgi:hypothetical protein
MFARHGIQNALRTRRRSVAFLLLLTLLVTLLGTSLGLSFALQETLRQCRGNYSTIGLVEYLGPGYPSTARVVEDAGEVLAEFESRLDRSDPALVDWEPTRMALGYTPALESLTDYSVLENRFALVIRLTEQATRRIKGQDPDFYLLLDPDGQLVWQWGTGTGPGSEAAVLLCQRRRDPVQRRAAGCESAGAAGRAGGQQRRPEPGLQYALGHHLEGRALLSGPGGIHGKRAAGPVL